MQQDDPPEGQRDAATGATEGDRDVPLVVRALAGSRDAFSELVLRHQRSVFLLCRRYVQDADTAAEVTQRAFIRAMERLPDLREATTFRGWLLRIAANLCLNHLRDHARFTSPESVEESMVPATAHEGIERRERRLALRRAVAELPNKQRVTLELRIYEELSFRDIAAALGTTEGAAKVNFHYAVRRLRGLLGDAS